MNIAIVPNHLLDSIKEEIFSKKDIINYIESLISILGLDKYFDGVIMSKEKNGNLATYNFKTKKITICYNMMIIDGLMTTKELNYSNEILLTNILIIESILHEIIHVYQNALFLEDNSPLTRIFYWQMINTKTISEEKYESVYNLMTYERDANITALENVLLIIRNFIKDFELFNYYLNLVRYKMLIGYNTKNSKLISPIETLYKEAFNELSPNILMDDTYDAIKLGIKVSKRKLTNFKHNYQDIIINKNHLNI